MLTRRIIPCLDIDGGRVVKGVKFRNLRDVGDPVELAARYAEEGADELVVLDVSATRDERASAAEVVAAMRRRIDLPLTFGGGIRTTDDAGRLLDAGADKIAVNTAAIRTPEIVGDMAARFGSQCTILSLDARRENPGTWEVVVGAGREPTGLDAAATARDAVAAGAGEVLLTSIDRDGAGTGYDLELIAAIRSVVPCPVIASGGAGKPEHLDAALAAGADAVLCASIFHDGVHDVPSIKRSLAERWPMRLDAISKGTSC